MLRAKPSKSFRSKSAASSRFVERLEGRQLFASFVPLVTETTLVSDDSTVINAPRADSNLVNPWGVAITPTGNVWVANNGTGTSTVYDQTGAPLPAAASPLVVTIPPPAGGSAAPTGTVFHKGNGFNVTLNGTTGPSSFLFASESGTISGWSQKVDPTHAVVAIDHSATGDVFKGLAQVGSGTSAKIFATDFRHAQIEVFNSKFQQVKLKAGAFTDNQVPATFAPFGIQFLNNKLYVTYAKQDAQKLNDVPGAALGIVDVYSTSGKLLKRVATGGDLNAPWGMAIAPGTWGAFKGDLLVGNFGDGTISVFDKKNNFITQVLDPTQANGTPLTLPGLWSLTPGVKGAKNTLFFSAGPGGETHGVLGTLTAHK
ncbi:MAG: repeat containing protein [Phycisphaerales bacterium]|nr:repeat containing protein [Phycisphaerales bacterium]